MARGASVSLVAAAGLIAILLSCSSSSGPDYQPEPVTYGSISGTVYLEGTTRPLSGVIVEIGDESDTTGDDGTYWIDSLPDGRYTLRAVRTEYDPFEEMINISGPTTFDVQLTIAIEAGTLHGHIWHSIYGPVSSVKISVAELYRYSDIEGYYRIENVPVGLQVVTFTHPGSYHGRTDTIYVTSSENVLDVSLLRTVENEVEVSDDAFVQYHGDSVSYMALTSGGSYTLRVYNRLLSQGKFIKNRVFLGLPQLPTGVEISDLETATLRMYVKPELSAGFAWNPMTLIVRRALEKWAEQSVTWLTMPNVEAEQFSAVKPPRSGAFEIDVLPIYLDGTDPGPGLRLALDSDEANASNSELIEMYSGESSDALRRPVVIFKYTH